MFNTPRWHRFLTVPALLVALAALVGGPHPLLALAMCPLVVALPFQLNAAWKMDVTAIAKGLTATSVVSYLGLAWGAILVVVFAPAGVIMLLAFSGLLVTAGTAVSETRLAAVMMIEGLLIGFVGLPMMWIGGEYRALVPAGFVLFAGATWWLAEASRAPVTTPDEAELPVAIAV